MDGCLSGDRFRLRQPGRSVLAALASARSLTSSHALSIPAERGVVTVLFADLVGFTALAERLDPEDVAVVQAEYFSAARHAVESRSGRIEKFIGDAVVGAFGVHRAKDDDAEQAVSRPLPLWTPYRLLPPNSGSTVTPCGCAWG